MFLRGVDYLTLLCTRLCMHDASGSFLESSSLCDSFLNGQIHISVAKAKLRIRLIAVCQLFRSRPGPDGKSAMRGLEASSFAELLEGRPPDSRLWKF